MCERLAFGVAGLLALSGSALASPAMTATPTIMRAAPSFHAAAVQSIPADAEIDVTGCGQYWCNASWREINGFVRVGALQPMEGGAPEEAPPPPPPPGFGGPPPDPFSASAGAMAATAGVTTTTKRPISPN